MQRADFACERSRSEFVFGVVCELQDTLFGIGADGEVIGVGVHRVVGPNADEQAERERDGRRRAEDRGLKLRCAR